MNNDAVLLAAVDLFLKGSLLVIFALLVVAVWKRASAAQRSGVWLAVFVTLALLPLSRMVAPRWTLTWPHHAQETQMPKPQVASPTSNVSTKPVSTVVIAASPAAKSWSGLNSMTVIVSIWAAGIFLMLTYRMMGFFLLRQCQRASFNLEKGPVVTLANSIAREYGIARPVEIRVTKNCAVPVTWGTWRPLILLPVDAQGWSREWLESVLSHKLGHVRNFDHLKRWFSFLVCAFYWPNPLVWLAARQLQLAQEEASDNLVLQAGASPESYATQLIETIRATSGRNPISLSAVAMARPSTLEIRLSAIMDQSRNRRGFGRSLATVVIAGVVFLSVVLGAVQLRAQAQPVPESAPASAGPAKDKFQSIVFDQLKFEQEDIRAVLEDIAKKKGIHFSLRLSYQPANGKDVAIDPRLKTQVTIEQKNISLDETLGLITAQTGLVSQVNKFDIYLRPPVETGDVMVVRTFLPVPNLLQVRPKVGAGTSLADEEQIDVKDQLQARGLLFPAGSSAVFLPASGKLIVRNSPEQLDYISILNDAMSRDMRKPVEMKVTP